MNGNGNNNDLTTAEQWLIKCLRAAGPHSRSLTVLLDNGSPTHIHEERRFKGKRLIKDILDDADYQEVVIKKTRGRTNQIIQRIFRKLH